LLKVVLSPFQNNFSTEVSPTLLRGFLLEHAHLMKVEALFK